MFQGLQLNPLIFPRSSGKLPIPSFAFVGTPTPSIVCVVSVLCLHGGLLSRSLGKSLDTVFLRKMKYSCYPFGYDIEL